MKIVCEQVIVPNLFLRDWNGVLFAKKISTRMCI
jgi:hypothetical protein